MNLLSDSNSEVQGMAMKCLAPLVSFVEIINASYVVGKLLDHVLNGNQPGSTSRYSDSVGIKAMRDVSSLALKSIFAELEPESSKATVIAKSISPRIGLTIRNTKASGDSIDLLIEIFELLNDILTRMGALLGDQHHELCSAILNQLPSHSAMITKRAIQCLGALSVSCDNRLFDTITTDSISKLQAKKPIAEIRTSVQIIWMIAKKSGHRLTTYVDIIAPLLLQFNLSEDYEDDDELREHCFQTLSSFCFYCKQEMLPFGDDLANCAKELAKYDPNYFDDDDETDDNQKSEMIEDDEDIDEEFDDDGDYSDDDDSSWKVRRAAMRCIISTMTAGLLPREKVFAMFGPFLITRFKEREEFVKLEVFAAFSKLLTFVPTADQSMTDGRNITGSHLHGEDAMAVDASNDKKSELSPLLSRGSQTFRNLKKEMRNKSLKVRYRAMTIVRELLHALPIMSVPIVGEVIPEIVRGLEDSNTAIKIEALKLLKAVVNFGGTKALYDHVEKVVPRILAAAHDRYYRVTSECLRCLGDMLMAFGSSSPECKQKFSPFVKDIHDAAVYRTTAQDQDSEVKEAALQCLGGTVSCFGMVLSHDRLMSISQIFLDRLRNEVTRFATVRTLKTICKSDFASVLQPLLLEITKTVAGFLRKSNNHLRKASLDLLAVAPELPPDCDSLIVTNASELVADSDLGEARKALHLASCMLRKRGNAIVPVFANPGSAYEKAVNLTSSPLIQGEAVEALIELFKILSEVNATPLKVDKLLTDLTSIARTLSSNVTGFANRTSPLHCVAKCIVAVCDSADISVRRAVLQEIIKELDSHNIEHRIFSLVCLGEFGRSSGSFKTGAEKEEVKSPILDAMNAEEDEVRSAAAIALGGIVSADGAEGITSLIDFMKTRSEHRYLLLTALKEAIGGLGNNELKAVIPCLLPILMESPESKSNSPNERFEMGTGKQKSEQESIRTAGAECLGLLAYGEPDTVIPTLMRGAASPNVYTRMSATAAVKIAAGFPSFSHSLTEALRSNIYAIVQLINDKNVYVAKNALQAVHAIASRQPQLLAPLMPDIQQNVFARLKKNKDYVEVVDLGPFKHEEDFGLDMRKSAFDLVRGFVTSSLCSSISIPTVLQRTLLGFTDQSDIRAIAQATLADAASTSYAPQLSTIIDPIVKALEANFNEKVKSNAVRQELERHEESIRGALRAVRVLESVPEVSHSKRFQAFMSSIVRTSKFIEKYDAIAKSEGEVTRTNHVVESEYSNVALSNELAMFD